ncbi:MAG: hypothetical protein IT518_22375 [Burkholderiales bacterium]|nr:hypothetical protein [Burkholderiales bacterium]
MRLLAAAALAASLAWPFIALAQAAQPADAPSLSWQFGAPAVPPDGGWTAERGRILAVDGTVRLQPDPNRRVVLVSPPGLPDAVRHAERFVVAVEGTGLRRVRVQGRRDERGGWITLADAAAGKGLREGPDGFVLKRAGARGAPIERLRIELEFRTTNPRTLRRIAAAGASPIAKAGQ